VDDVVEGLIAQHHVGTGRRSGEAVAGEVEPRSPPRVEEGHPPQHRALLVAIPLYDHQHAPTRATENVAVHVEVEGVRQRPQLGALRVRQPLLADRRGSGRDDPPHAAKGEREQQPGEVERGVVVHPRTVSHPR
jgi:hypothetical protein